MMVTSGLNAKRFAGKPLRQPLYQFGTIEKCNRDLKESTLYEVTNREDFVNATAEMVLLCNEAMRRSKQTAAKKTSKPLSLEYIADRLDIDDPMHGYFVRDKESKLQGFITCTTFTNWQKSFRWDSIHDSSFSYDEKELSTQMLEGERPYDEDGSLAAELQQSTRCGDPWNEGIVWPRIAEISLLGGLGCGKTLLSLAIERLEAMKPTRNQNYDFVVLQATENSVPFYESMGFTRVGALTVDDQFRKKRQAESSASEGSETETDATETDESETAQAVPVTTDSPDSSQEGQSEIVSSPYTTYIVERGGESPADVAKRFNVSVWDIVFLNQYVYPDLTSRSYLMKGTRLFVPSDCKAKADACSFARTKKDLEGESSAPRWFIAKENDTPKSISKKFGVVCKDVVAANVGRLPGLLPISRLKEGTRIRVSHFHLHDDEHVPYCHWTFPDGKFEDGEPSYMMARKLNRVSGALAKARPVQSSLAVPVSKNERPPESLFHVVTAPAKTPNKKTSNKKATPKAATPKPTLNLPGKPKRPLSAYIIFCNENRVTLRKALAGKPASEYSKVLSVRWKQLGEKQKAGYQKKHEAAKKEYEKAMKKYATNLERFFEKHPEMRPSIEQEEESDDDEDGDEETLFCKVVTVKPGALGEAHKEFKYFYVLTYIPDLVWCHLAPMRQVGVWGDEKPQCDGRPKWMLVDESEGKEVDVSASFCEQVKSKAMNRTADADEEQWDIVDSGTPKKMPARRSPQRAAAVAPESTNGANAVAKKVASRAGKKPSVAKSVTKQNKRKRESVAATRIASPRRLHRTSPGGDSDELPPASKKRKTSPTKKQVDQDVKARAGTREVPRRKAAPTAEGVFSVDKAFPTIRAERLPAKKAPAKTLKRRGRPRKNPPAADRSTGDSHVEEKEIKVPLKKAPAKTLKKRGRSRKDPPEADRHTDDAQVEEKEMKVPVRKAPAKTLKKRGRPRKDPPEADRRTDDAHVEEKEMKVPVRKAPAKTLKKRGRPRKDPPAASTPKAAASPTKRHHRSTGDVEKKEMKVAKNDAGAPSASASLGARRDLPRRRAAPTAAGFFSEATPTKRPWSYAPVPLSASKEKKKGSPVAPRFRAALKGLQEKPKMQVQGHDTPSKQKPIVLSPRKRARIERVLTSPFRQLPNRKAAPIFDSARQRAALDLAASPLLLRRVAA